MVALAPITNERPAWDVLDTFPKLHSRAREAKSGNPLSKSLTYSYDAVGNRRSLDAPDSGRFSYVYDAADQLSSVLNPFSGLTTFSYDIAGRRTVQRYSNGTRASIIYDTANNVTQFHNRTSTGTAITTNDYKYDNVGNRTGMLEASGDRLTWTYDNGDQLKSERRSGASGYANTFTYDGVGNRTLKNAGATRTTFSYDIADQLVYSQSVAGRTSYVYDNAGNQQIERPPTGSRTTTVWDNENRPTLYRLPDTTLVTMSYNGNNHRVTKQSATETVKFVWDPAADAYLAEFNSSNVLQATYSQEPVQFGRTLSQRRSTTSSWYHTDALGSTQALSNSSQITSDTYLYDAWGNPITSTGTTVNPFRWVGNVGYYFDSDTGLYYIRARTYQPIIARWTSADPLFYMLAKAGALRAFTRDPIGFKAGDANLYRYDSPSTAVDPSGNESWIPIPYIPGVGPINPITGQPVMPGPTPQTSPNYTIFELSMCTAQLHVVANTQFAHGYECAGQLLLNFLSNNSQSCPSNCAEALRQAVTSGVDIPLPPADDRDSMLRGRARCNANTNHYFTYSGFSIFPGGDLYYAFKKFSYTYSTWCNTDCGQKNKCRCCKCNTWCKGNVNISDTYDFAYDFSEGKFSFNNCAWGLQTYGGLNKMRLSCLIRDVSFKDSLILCDEQS